MQQNVANATSNCRDLPPIISSRTSNFEKRGYEKIDSLKVPFHIWIYVRKTGTGNLLLKILNEMEIDIALEYKSVDTFLLGRKTYENLSQYWPNITRKEERLADFYE